MASIFRQASMERLSSPEQLDTLLEVTTPKGWLALLSLTCLIVGAIVWSFIGRLPTHVSGVGILVKKEGLVGISVLASGQLAAVSIKTGDMVRRDQIVARLSLPDLETELGNTEANLSLLSQQHEQLKSFGTIDTRLQAEAQKQQAKLLTDQIQVAVERQELYSRKVAELKKLLEEGLITDQVLQAQRDSLIQARADVERAKSSLRELSVRKSGHLQQLQKEQADRLIRLDEMRRRIHDLKEKIRLSSLVRSPAKGRVIEVRAAVGSFLIAGTPIVMIELSGEQGEGLQAIVYVPGTDGKKVQPGMVVEVSPSTIKREEYGAMRARVTEVSEFPATSQAIMAKLGNQELAASFFRAIENPIELKIDILPSAETPSGYEWSSPKGPPQTVQPGTLCTALITVRERRPITLVVPMLRERFNL